MTKPIFQAYKPKVTLLGTLNLAGFTLLFFSARWSDVCFGLWSLLTAASALKVRKYEQTIGLLGITLCCGISWLPVQNWKITLAGYVLMVCSSYLAFHEAFAEYYRAAILRHRRDSRAD